MNIRTALAQGQKLLEDAAISAPRLTAEVLLAHAVRQDRPWLYAHSDEELREVWWIHYGRYLHERINGKPTQYITGRQEFYGREFRVAPGVLIPRPETEHLVEAALRLGAAAKTILDIGTGSGAIAISLALEAGARVFAADISEAAVRIASKNAATLNTPVHFCVCDLGTAFRSSAFDLIVSNPPYIPEAESIQREVRDYEPHIALFGGPDGLAAYRSLIPQAWSLLKPGGWLAMEIGYLAAESVGAMLGEWNQVTTFPDLAGIPRVITAQRP